MAVMRVLFTKAKRTKAHQRGASLATQYERKFYPAIRSALRGLQERVKLAPIARAITEDNVEGVLDATRVDRVKDLVADFATELPAAARAGGESAARALGLTRKVALQKQVFDMGRPLIADWLRDHAGALITQVTDRSRQAVRRIVEHGVLNGRHPAAMAKDVKMVIGLHERQANAIIRRREALEEAGVRADRIEHVIERYSRRLLDQRARTIARTEALTAVNRGRYALWQQLVEDGALDPTHEQRWDTAEDEAVCPICGPMNGQRRKLNEPFTTPRGGEIEHPPAHVQCLPPGMQIASGRAVAATKRAYSGDLVHIETALGPRLSVTPNHPVLTRRGMIAAKLIKHGDDVLCASHGQGMAPLVGPDGEALPSPVEEVFDALRLFGSADHAHVPSTTMQFHGDGSSHGHVDVVGPARYLGTAANSKRSKKLHQRHGVLGRVSSPPRFPGQSALLEFLFGALFAIGRMMGRINLGSSRPFRHLGPFERLCLATAAALDVGLGQNPAYWAPRNAEVPRDSVLRHSAGVQAHNVSLWQLESPAAARRLISLALFIGSAFRAQGQGFLYRALLDPPDGETPIDLTPDDPQVATDLPHGKSGDVHVSGLFGLLSSQGLHPSPVCHVGITSYTGVVHNLETRDGWYTANGIVASNCRCVVGLV